MQDGPNYLRGESGGMLSKIRWRVEYCAPMVTVNAATQALSNGSMAVGRDERARYRMLILRDASLPSGNIQRSCILALDERTHW